MNQKRTFATRLEFKIEGSIKIFWLRALLNIAYKITECIIITPHPKPYYI